MTSTTNNSTTSTTWSEQNSSTINAEFTEENILTQSTTCSTPKIDSFKFMLLIVIAVMGAILLVLLFLLLSILACCCNQRRKLKRALNLQPTLHETERVYETNLGVDTTIQTTHHALESQQLQLKENGPGTESTGFYDTIPGEILEQNFPSNNFSSSITADDPFRIYHVLTNESDADVTYSNVNPIQPPSSLAVRCIDKTDAKSDVTTENPVLDAYDSISKPAGADSPALHSTFDHVSMKPKKRQGRKLEAASNVLQHHRKTGRPQSLTGAQLQVLYGSIDRSQAAMAASSKVWALCSPLSVHRKRPSKGACKHFNYISSSKESIACPKEGFVEVDLHTDATECSSKQCRATCEETEHTCTVPKCTPLSVEPCTT